MIDIVYLWNLEFFRFALLGGGILSLLCGLVGPMVVIRKEAMIGHTLANLCFLGITIGLLFSLPVELPAFSVLLLGVCSIFFLTEHGKLSHDSVLAYVAQMSMAGALLCVGLLEGFRSDPLRYLFGDILAISSQDLLTSVVLGVLVLLVLSVSRKGIIQVALQRDIAIAHGIPVRMYEFLYLLMVSVVVYVGMKMLGVLLLSSFLIIPGNIAKLWTTRFTSFISLSVLFAFLGVTIGLFLAYILNIPSGASIILLLGILLLLSFALQLLRRN